MPGSSFPNHWATSRASGMKCPSRASVWWGGDTTSSFRSARSRRHPCPSRPEASPAGDALGDGALPRQALVHLHIEREAEKCAHEHDEPEHRNVVEGGLHGDRPDEIGGHQRLESEQDAPPEESTSCSVDVTGGGTLGELARGASNRDHEGHQ